MFKWRLSLCSGCCGEGNETARQRGAYVAIIAGVSTAIGVSTWHREATAEPPKPATSVTASTASDAARVKRDLSTRMWKRVSVDLKENTLADALAFYTAATGLTLDVVWMDDKNPTGLNKDTPITLKADNLPAITLLERILDKAATDAGGTAGANAWQLTEEAQIQIGPKERLNAFKRTETYDVRDLLIEIRDFNNAPKLDITQTSGGNSGSGQSPFQGGNTGGTSANDTGKSLDERAKDLVKIITETVEPEQWRDNGGNGASLTLWRGTLVITAPEYIHRQLDGDGKGASTTLKIIGGVPSATAPKANATPAADKPAESPAAH
jgi:hypothetical protein